MPLDSLTLGDIEPVEWSWPFVTALTQAWLFSGVTTPPCDRELPTYVRDISGLDEMDIQLYAYGSNSDILGENDKTFY